MLLGVHDNDETTNEASSFFSPRTFRLQLFFSQNVIVLVRLLSFCQLLHTSKSGEKGNLLRRFCRRTIGRLPMPYVKFVNALCRVWNPPVLSWQISSAKKCAEKWQNSLFCKVKMSIWQSEGVEVKRIAFWNMLWYRRLGNPLRFKCLFSFGGRKTGSEPF